MIAVFFLYSGIETDKSSERYLNWIVAAIFAII